MGRSTDKETGLSEQRKYRMFTAQRKLEIVLAGLRGDRSVREVCREHAISETLYYGWRDQLLEAGKERFAGKEERQGDRELRRKVAELERALGRKTYELERLSRKPGLSSDPTTTIRGSGRVSWEVGEMAFNFVSCDREQEFLLPPSLREWLPEDHLAWFLIDAVEEMDLSAFLADYRADGWGRAAYEPRMMVTLLLYAYAVGERSSRQIERRCREDVAFRVITANLVPDHATIARFRERHDRALAELFVEGFASVPRRDSFVWARSRSTGRRSPRVPACAPTAATQRSATRSSRS